MYIISLEKTSLGWLLGETSVIHKKESMNTVENTYLLL